MHIGCFYGIVSAFIFNFYFKIHFLKWMLLKVQNYLNTYEQFCE